MVRREITVPELGLDAEPIVLSLWLVELGAAVEPGEPIVELACGPATIDLSSPTQGRLAETLADEDDALNVGQAIAVIEGC